MAKPKPRSKYKKGDVSIPDPLENPIIALSPAKARSPQEEMSVYEDMDPTDLDEEEDYLPEGTHHVCRW